MSSHNIKLMVENLCLTHEKTKAELRLEKTKNKILRKELDNKDKQLKQAHGEGKTIFKNINRSY